MEFGDRFHKTAIGAMPASGEIESDGVMDVWDRGEIPGATGQRTRLEITEVVRKVGDDR